MRAMRFGVAMAAASAVVAIGVSGAAASGTFVEPVDVIATLHGTGTPGANFGWAVSELGDVDNDGVTDVIVGEPFTDTGTTWVFSGRTGAEIHRLDGEPGDLQGFSMADAGDVDGDGIHDILSGASGRGAGHVYLYSGATGTLLHTFAGEDAGDEFGWAVAGVGDVDGDDRDDIAVGAPARLRSGVAGAAYVFSGRTYELIRKVPGIPRHGGQFGSAVDGAGDLDGDGVPDLVVGARDAPPHERGVVWAFSGADGQPLWRHRAAKTGAQYGSFFVAGIGDANGDGEPDVYAADYADGGGAGRATVLSGLDGTELAVIEGAPGAGLGPGREAGDLDGDGLVDLAVGSFTYGPDQAGRIELRSGRDGSVLRTITSTTPGENLGFDTVGIGDANGDGRPDLVASAATGETVYILAG